MSESQCASADWYAYGYEDGTRGASPGMANQRASACYKHGVDIDHARYQNGRDAGLFVYCTPDRGYDLGRSGGAYGGACVNHNERAFLAGFDQGVEMRLFEAPVAVAEHALAEAEQEEANLNRTLTEYATGARPFEEHDHNEKVLDLWSKRQYLRREVIPYWRAELRAAERELGHYEARRAAGDPNAGFAPPRPASGPAPWRGPTAQDARDMVAEVFAALGGKSR